MGLKTPAQTQACPGRGLIGAAWTGRWKGQSQRTMAPGPRGRLIALPSEQARLLFSFLRGASWSPCTVPGGVKGCCRAPLCVRPVDTRRSPGDAGCFPPCVPDSHKWEKLRGGDPSPTTGERHLSGDGGFVHPGNSWSSSCQVTGERTLGRKGV